MYTLWSDAPGVYYVIIFDYDMVVDVGYLQIREEKKLLTLWPALSIEPMTSYSLPGPQEPETAYLAVRATEGTGGVFSQ